MAVINWKDKVQIEAEEYERQRQLEIKVYEEALEERYQAFYKLLATNAPQEEIDACKQEIQMLIEPLEVLRSGTT